MRFQPKRARLGDCIDCRSLPPNRFVAAVMDLAVVSAAERHSEFVTDLTSERVRLRKAKVMCIRGTATTNQARLLGDESLVIFVPDPTRFRQGQLALIDRMPSSDTDS